METVDGGKRRCLKRHDGLIWTVGEVAVACKGTGEQRQIQRKGNLPTTPSYDSKGKGKGRILI